jgi:hypothetical protein
MDQGFAGTGQDRQSTPRLHRDAEHAATELRTALQTAQGRQHRDKAGGQNTRVHGRLMEIGGKVTGNHEDWTTGHMC